MGVVDKIMRIAEIMLNLTSIMHRCRKQLLVGGNDIFMVVMHA